MQRTWTGMLILLVPLRKDKLAHAAATPAPLAVILDVHTWLIKQNRIPVEMQPTNILLPSSVGREVGVSRVLKRKNTLVAIPRDLLSG